MDRTRFMIASLLFSMTNAVLFGAGLLVVLLTPGLQDHLMGWIPAVVAASFAFAAPIAWMIAPRLRARFWRRQNRINALGAT